MAQPPSKKRKIDGDEREMPGDPRQPQTFLKIDNNEGKLAAYIGFANTKFLRVLIATWPFLRANMDYAAIPGTNISYQSAYRLLADGKINFQGIENPAEQWKPDSGDTAAVKKSKRDHRYAAILNNLMEDIGKLGSISVEDNNAKQAAYVKIWRIRNDVQVPEVVFGDDGTVGLPMLGPLAEESPLEPLNRCTQTLRYMRNTLSTVSMKNRFTQPGIAVSVAVNANVMPWWMRPKAPQVNEPLELAAVAAADRLPARQFNIIWQARMDSPDRQDELKEKLQRASDLGMTVIERGNAVPIQVDPRLFTSSASFRDSLRRQFQCQEIQMNIRCVRITYRSAGIGPENYHVIKGEQRELADEILMSEEYTDLLFEIGFFPIEEDELDIYEGR